MIIITLIIIVLIIWGLTNAPNTKLYREESLSSPQNTSQKPTTIMSTNNKQIVYVVPAAKSHAAYILFALFFGNLGIHDFYAGYTGEGIVKVAVSITSLYLIFGRAIQSAVLALAGNPPNIKAVLGAPLIGVILLVIQAFYIFYQIITVKEDIENRPLI